MHNPGQPLIGVPCRGDGSTSYKECHMNTQNSSYVRAIINAGGAPFLIPLEACDDVLRILFEQADGILLTGGGDIDPRFFGKAPHPSLRDVQPARDELELTLSRWALNEGKPLFGICRGIQVMNVAAGGTLYQDIASQLPGADQHDFPYDSDSPRDLLAHQVNVEPDSRLGATLGNGYLPVNSSHHQALKHVPPVYRVVAHSPDGVIEGIEAPHHPFAVGVQWHPEELVAGQDAAQRLFLAFVIACRHGKAEDQRLKTGESRLEDRSGHRPV